MSFTAPVLDYVVELHRDEGIEFRAHDRATGSALRLVFVSVSDVSTPGDAAKFSIGLNDAGSGRLPSALMNDTLTTGRSTSCQSR